MPTGNSLSIVESPMPQPIDMYNSEKVEVGPRVQGLLITYSVMMKGFTIGDYVSRFPEGMTQLAQWLVEVKMFKKAVGISVGEIYIRGLDV